MFAGLFLATSMVLSDPAAKPAAVPADLHQVEYHVIQRMNTERKRHRLFPLRVDRRLVRSARRHTAWMTRTGNLTHTTAPVGENIAMGQHNSSEVVRDWMNSPGHRANMLNASYSRVGAAAYKATDGTVYWCLQFQQ